MLSVCVFAVSSNSDSKDSFSLPQPRLLGFGLGLGTYMYDSVPVAATHTGTSKLRDDKTWTWSITPNANGAENAIKIDVDAIFDEAAAIGGGAEDAMAVDPVQVQVTATGAYHPILNENDGVRLRYQFLQQVESPTPGAAAMGDVPSAVPRSVASNLTCRISTSTNNKFNAARPRSPASITSLSSRYSGIGGINIFYPFRLCKTIPPSILSTHRQWKGWTRRKRGNKTKLRRLFPFSGISYLFTQHCFLFWNYFAYVSKMTHVINPELDRSEKGSNLIRCSFFT